ncbi:uncharacterized protein SCHCODRAFT_02700665 [Schizophyllum commune H4-8]|uniref:Tubby C-terminal domain-containing protein n=1 Tax=Schizophyllum commune (strain H4-8 / FGSC 9210) TaxID=578458 RepID=D8PKD7_SCHCM|nr:uncharacterized protein SCHCODRAFT_02700665 [Schizophyllum commune H4-8]KAI5894114.1 hypothetical protein SCHCODRAFT_02700665 [Schizophyllum commune H4-8]
MSTSVTLTFGKEDILNTILTFPDGTIAFSTTTKESFWKGRDTTVMQGQNYFAKTHASIDWRDKYFDINGQVLPFDRIKHTKTLSSKRWWTWGGFTVEMQHHHGEWTASVPSGAVIARYRSYKGHLFHDNEHAQLTVDFDLASPEATFLILCFLYTETRRLEDEQAARNASHAAHAAN